MTRKAQHLSSFYLQERRRWVGKVGIAPYHVLEDQLTLSQTGGRLCPTQKKQTNKKTTTLLQGVLT